MSVAAERHRVYLPESDRLVLTRARCDCGWSTGYDPTTRHRAMLAAHAHVQDAYLEALENHAPEGGSIGDG